MAGVRRVQKIPAGQAITAGWIAALVDTVNALADSVGGDGGGGGAGGSTAATLAAMAGGIGGAPPLLIGARIGEVVKDTSVGPAGQRAPVNGSYWPSQVKYVIAGIGAVNMPQTPLTPFYGRPVRGDEARIYPAAEGALCFIERYPDPDAGNAITVRLYLLPGSPGGEVVARRRCGE